ncbi:MAG: Fe-S cluster assembly protein SufD [Elusimicrobia bacterium]|nr:Fe-S cluster assembly protein SufD [Elusimicrobiota bacterium]
MSSQAPAQDSILSAKLEAFEAFLKEPEPARTVEEWRRTRFSEWSLARLKAPMPDGAGLTLEARNSSQGVSMLPLEEALRDERFGALARRGLDVQASPAYRKFELASRALWSRGAFVHVAKGVQVAQPLHLCFSYGRGFAFPRVVAVLEEGSSATIIEEHRAAGAAQSSGSSIAFSHLALGPGAEARYFYLQDVGADDVHFWSQRCELKSQASLQHGSILLGGRVHKSRLEVDLQEAGARTELNGAILGSKEQVFDFHSSQRHAAPNTQSNLLFDSVLMGRARSIYTGLIRVEEGAVECDAYQANHNLLLSSEARADTTPLLEILTDAVRCKHGATAGPLNADDLFYMASRGLSVEEAEQMLVMGFFAPVLAKIPSPEIGARLESRMAQRLLRKE